MRRIFVTNTVPQKSILKYKLSIAANNFCYNLIDTNIFSKVYSILPTTIYGKLEKFDGLIYSPLRNVKFLVYISLFVENLILFNKIKKNDNVWFYNLSVLNIFLVLLLKYFKPSVNVYLIILDFTPQKTFLNKIMLYIINNVEGIIKLANSELFTNKNSICMPGIVPIVSDSYPIIKKNMNKFLVSGALGENISMLSMLLDAFSEMPELNLNITGQAKDLEIIRKYTNTFSNIKYFGIIPYNEYINLLHQNTFLLSTRNPNCPENKCNFPSKIIEGLLHNRIIISTIHYEQLSNILYLKVASEKNQFIADIRQIVNMPEDDLMKYANQSNKTIENFNSIKWINAINKIENYEK